MKKFFISLLFFTHIIIGYTQETNTTNSNIAANFLSSLNKNQKAKALLSQNDSLRTDWHYLPWSSFKREGISLKELSENQKTLVHDLLRSHLSKSGYEKTKGVLTLEGILADITQDYNYRDVGKYYITFYGEPNLDKPWSWAFEGHHVSLNFTIDNHKVSYVPMFFGANPGIVLEGPKKGHRSLVDEEDMGIKLINMLDEAQQQKAIIHDSTFNDVLSLNKSKATPLNIEGIAATELNKEQQKLLFSLIDVYLSSAPEKVAAERKEKIIKEELSYIYFAWAGAKEVGLGKPHYYRIQGKSFLLEFDNTQNNANHIHVVWRDFNADFGRDLIKAHYHSSDHHH